MCPGWLSPIRPPCVLMIAAVTLRKRGGGLVLLRPRPALSRLMEIMDADQVITIC
jgi:anti-anti-sigma regulatory factor